MWAISRWQYKYPDVSQHVLCISDLCDLSLWILLLAIPRPATMPAMPGDTTREWDPLYGTIDGMYEYRKTGLLCLPCMTEGLMDAMMNEFEFREGDILVASYPQSGRLIYL